MSQSHFHPFFRDQCVSRISKNSINFPHFSHMNLPVKKLRDLRDSSRASSVEIGVSHGVSSATIPTLEYLLGFASDEFFPAPSIASMEHAKKPLRRSKFQNQPTDHRPKYTNAALTLFQVSSAFEMRSSDTRSVQYLSKTTSK